MAAYAAVVSLMNTIIDIQIHPRFSTCFSNEQIESLCDTAGFLLDFVESYNCSGSSKEVEDLEAEIASAAHAAELWEMVQLRHVQVRDLYLPDPPRNDRGDVVLPYLQTLCNAMNFRLSKEVCKRIPNVKKLNLQYQYGELPRGCDAGSYYYPQNLGRFHKLESLSLQLSVSNCRPMVLNMTFPSSLKKLSLVGGGLRWKDLEMVGSLPNLEVLKLWTFSVTGSNWSPVEGQFQRLKYLQIYFCDNLTKWNADSFHYPVLEKLVLGEMQRLDEIPPGIGEILTLKSIRLFQCSVPTSLSAVKILEEQESCGNEDLQVEVVFHIYNNDGA